MATNLLRIRVLIFFFLSLTFAAQASDEKPIWGLASDAPYTLTTGSFNTSVLGWITYGMAPRLQIGTNFLADAFQMYNFYWKFQLDEERGNLPALSIGAIHYYKLFGAEGAIDPSVTFAKTLGPQFTLYGGVSRFSTTSLLVNAIRGSAKQSFLGRMGVIINNSLDWHSYVELGAAIPNFALIKDLGFGVEWASRDMPFRLKLGGYFPAMVFIPIVDIYWRF